MSGNSQTIRDFTFCRPSQIYRIIATILSLILPMNLAGNGKCAKNWNLRERGTGAQQFGTLEMSEIHRRSPRRYKFEFSFVGKDRRPSQKSGTRRENRNAPDSPDRNRRYPRSSGMAGDKSGESGAFLFSRRVPDFCDGRRSFSTNENSNLYRRGRRRLFRIPQIAGLQSPHHASFNFWRTFHFWPNSSGESERELWRLSDISGTVFKKWKPRSSGIFPTYEKQALWERHVGNGRRIPTKTFVFEFSYKCVNSSLEELIKIKIIFILRQGMFR